LQEEGKTRKWRVKEGDTLLMCIKMNLVVAKHGPILLLLFAKKFVVDDFGSIHDPKPKTQKL
jgi:hypothetical protein